MKLNTLRAGGLAAAALTLSLGLTACGGDEPSTSANGTTQSDNTSKSDKSDEPMAQDASADTYGAGCAQVPTDGAGSFNGMATAPVASAASANPLLKTLVAAVTEAGLVEPLNSAPKLTVFAPADPAPPDGVTLRTFRSGDEDEALQMFEDAFAEVPGRPASTRCGRGSSNAPPRSRTCPAAARHTGCRARSARRFSSDRSTAAPWSRRRRSTSSGASSTC